MQEKYPQFVCSKLFNDLIIKYPSHGIKNCCKTTNNNNIPIEDITDDYFINNALYMNNQSTMLFSNKLPAPTCNTCIKTEPNSLFRTWNEFGPLSESKKKSLYGNDNFTRFEFMMSSACDLKCVYCAPKDSSAWAKELGVPVHMYDDRWKDHVTSVLLNYLDVKIWDKSQEYWFTFSGGEPTYNIEMIQFIETIMKKVPSDINANVAINTNLNTKEIILNRLLTYIRNNHHLSIFIFGSLDSVADKCEAIRYGVSWKRAIYNIKKYFEYDNVQVCLAPTVNLLSIPTMYEFVVYFKELYNRYNKLLHFTENMVAEPRLSPRSMLPEHKSLLIDAIKFCESENITYARHLYNIKNLIGTACNKSTQSAVKKHLKYLQDNRPKTDWIGLFPHLKDIIDRKHND